MIKRVRKSIRVGIICEGGPSFEDEQVLTHLAEHILGHDDVMCLPQGSKPELFAECGKVAAQMLNTDQCDRVLIVWDLEPSFSKQPSCRHSDRQKVFASLESAGLVNHPCVFLVCINRELETWTLADGSAISAALHHPPHRAPRIQGVADESEGNPKGRLRRIFKQQHRNFDPKTDNLRIIRSLPRNFGALGKLPSFKRFGLKLTQAC